MVVQLKDQSLLKPETHSSKPIHLYQMYFIEKRLEMSKKTGNKISVNEQKRPIENPPDLDANWDFDTTHCWNNQSSKNTLFIGVN